MAYDGIVTKSVVESLKSKIIGGKINKINQPDRYEIHLLIYNNHNNYKLLINASSNLPRIYLTNEKKENPENAPTFCMFLRKHIQGGVISDVRQIGLDRIVELDILTFDELGQEILKTLVIEIMGKYSNIILTRKHDGYVYDSIKRVTLDMSRIRQVLPGSNYISVLDEKNDIVKDKIIPPSQMVLKIDTPVKIGKFFYQNYTGFSPSISKEICYMAYIDFNRATNSLTETELEKIDQCFYKVTRDINNKIFTPTIIKDPDGGNTIDFHVISLTYIGGNSVLFNTPSEMLEQYYSSIATVDKVSQKSSSIKKILQNKLNRDTNKLSKYLDELESSKNRDIYKVYGDLISSSSHLIKKGDSEITVNNFYDPDLNPISIPLQISKSPWENAQFYYKKYSKLKTASKLLSGEIPVLKDEIKYLEQLFESLNSVTENGEIDEIKQELMAIGLLKSSKNKKSKKVKSSKPYHFISSNGADIYVGKNNFQNDELTLKTANKDDYFVHAKDIPGSHVILRNVNISEQDILEAAFLAAKFSKQSSERFVQVDYTYKKNVRKAKGSKPGMVYYEKYETVLIDQNNFDFDNFRKL